MGVKTRKKLIEVALPLDAINKASVRENYIYRGNPSSIHKWWAQRPLAAARAVIFSQMVDDPSEYVDTLKMDDKLRRRADNELKKRLKVWAETVATKDKADAAGVDSPDPGPEPTLDEILAEQERDRLFKIIEELVVWENTTNEVVLEKARAEIWQSWRRTCSDNVDHPQAKALFDRNKLPGFHDPFAGGGTLPLEAQRLGLEAYASDLNPVAVLINKALIEIPPKFAGREPVNPKWHAKSLAEKALHGVWKGAEGLAEDVRYYGEWMREEAEKRIGHLYSKMKISDEMIAERPDLKQYLGKELNVIAWIWARTVKSPNPAFRDVDVPLASTFMLSTKAGKEAYVEPLIENDGYRFVVKVGKPKDGEAAKLGTSAGPRSGFICLMSKTPLPYNYIREEGKAGGMSERLMAIVAEGDRGRVYLSPTADQEVVAASAKPTWKPEVALPDNPRDFKTPNYGMPTFGDLFTLRQLVALTTFADLVGEAMEQIRRDFDGQAQDTAKVDSLYPKVIGAYLAFAVDKYAMYGNSLVPWYSKESRPSMLFSRQAIPMVWDYTEVNPFSDMGGSLIKSLEIVAGALEGLPFSPPHGFAEQRNAAETTDFPNTIVSTDPPYYDNIGYADLSDFFYVWLRFILKDAYPELFTTLTVPKSDELVATPYRHEGSDAAETFFLNGMTSAMNRLAVKSLETFPVTIYYAFKQSETISNHGVANTGWETFLTAVVDSGFALLGTWPIRTERQGRMIGNNTNSLASSIVLVCRKRLTNAPTVARREFVNALKSELPEALRHLQRGNIAPVDLAQAAIGPGMAVFTRYEKVLDAEGNKLSVRDALAMINHTLDEVLAEQEGDFDADTRWALVWFDQFGFEEGDYGNAETLSKSKNTSVAEMADSKNGGIIESKAGKVRLKRPAELSEEWDPATDPRLTVWEMTHHLIRVLEKDGETAAARIATKLGARAETARELCYRLYTMCERKKRAQEALSYNGLVQSWPEIVRLAAEQTTSTGGEEQILPGM